MTWQTAVTPMALRFHEMATLQGVFTRLEGEVSSA
jgi:hypothetical protein